MIKAFLSNVLGQAWGYIVAGLGLIAGVLTIFFQAKKAGKDEVVAETAKKEVENAQKANEVERKVLTAKPDDRRSKLRDKWTRD